MPNSFWEMERDANRRELENLYEAKSTTWEYINGYKEELSGVNAYLHTAINEIKTMRGAGWADARRAKQAEIDKLKEEKEDLKKKLDDAFSELSNIKDEIQSIKDRFD